MSGAPALHALRDVPGVIGSFTCDMLGELIACDMPARFSRSAIEAAAVRLGNLLQSSDEALSEARGISLCFAEHQLHARRYSAGMLCILTQQTLDLQKLEHVACSVVADLQR